MSATKLGALLSLILAGGLCAGGCNQSGRARGTGAAERDVLPAEQRSLEARPGEARSVQESDLARVQSGTLFVQNPARGLAVIDVSDPDRPALRHQLTSLTGVAGELYLRGPDLLVVFRESLTTPGSTEVVGVGAAATAPVLGQRLTIEGALVESRLVGDLLYLVTHRPSQTLVSAVDVRDARAPVLRRQSRLFNQGDRALITDRAIYVAEDKRSDADLLHDTLLTYVEITSPQGWIVEKGSLYLAGAPQGRFHMDQAGSTLRIVTWSGRARGSNLFVIDTSDPSDLRVRGSLEGLAPGEDLRATRFVGDRAYVVTFQPQTVILGGGGGGGFFIMDPLWVISLADPARPEVLGELEVPGWSDYVFPRGDRLLAVGRGGAVGETVAAALFDVSDPRAPRLLRRLEFGVPSAATSEANSDFRGVAVVESGTLPGGALVAIPYTDNLHDAQGRCAPEHFVQLFDLRPDDLVLRGRARETGLVRRVRPIGGRLYAVTDKTVAAIDVTDRSAPTNAVTLEVGDVAAVESCAEVFVPAPNVVRLPGGGCSLGAGRGEGETGSLVLALLVALLLLRGRYRLDGRERA